MQLNSGIVEIDLDGPLTLTKPDDIELEYPCFILDNLVFKQELDNIISDIGLPAYSLNSSGKVTMLGYINPSIYVILRAKFLKIDISFRRTETDIIRFENFSDLVPFIVI